MIENELKFVLKPGLYDMIHMGMCPELAAVPERMINQFYLEEGGRLRSDSVGDLERCTFNYKLTLPNGEVEEFEMEIDADTYDRAVAGAVSQLTKIRFTVLDDGFVWDVDFFIDPKDGSTYFAMAECEMPRHVSEPTYIPKFISEHLIYTVPRWESSDYSSKRLADREYATEKLKACST